MVALHMNFTESRPPDYEICSYQELIQVKLSNTFVALSVILLLIINVMVIAGNILVILAVFVSSKLRTSTNYFIVSLAMADLLVGLAVLPYSLTHEILDSWVFGEVWCQGWLVVDVWLCTASILNLCAISVDRYLAVTRPVRYRSMMTSRRAKLVIAGIWALSFLICFPPLVGWNGNRSKISGEVTMPTPTLRTVVLVNETTSVSLPAAVSSSLPATSVNVLGNINASDRSSSISSSSGSTVSDISTNAWLSTTLSPGSAKNDSNMGAVADAAATCLELEQCTLFNEKGYVIYSALGSFYIPMFFMFFFYWRIYLVASRTTRALKRGYRTTKSSKSSQGGGSPEERMTLRIHRGEVNKDGSGPSGQTMSASPRPRTAGLFNKPTIIESHCADEVGTEMKQFQEQKKQSRRKLPITLYRSPRLTAHLAAQDASNQQQCDTALNGSGRDHNKLSPTPSINSNMYAASPSSPSSSREGSARLARFSRRANNSHTGKWQAKRFHAETKAAKTVGIIVGGFIICRFPFFTAYLIRAFCSDDCIPELLMSVFTWLGYCNSAINPVIYGLFSRDFRRAFKNIVCRCTCKEEVSVASLIRQIHLPTFFEEENMHDDMIKSNEEYK